MSQSCLVISVAHLLSSIIDAQEAPRLNVPLQNRVIVPASEPILSAQEHSTLAVSPGRVSGHRAPLLISELHPSANTKVLNHFVLSENTYTMLLPYLLN